MKKKIKEYIEIISLVLVMTILACLFIFAFKNARIHARDVKTIDDIRILQNALALYRYDVGAYPVSEQMQSGKELSHEDKIYLKSIPRPLEPNKDCQNQASYDYRTFKDEDDLLSYSISFCLNYKSGTFDSGLHAATPSGIK